MDCERVTELLPWLLNGALGAAEQQSAREHLAQCDKCRHELDETLLARDVYQQHVPADELVDYAFERRVASSRLDLIERHLKSCGECAEQLDLVKESRRLQRDDVSQASFVVLRKPQASHVLFWRYFAVAASVFAIIAVGAWLLIKQQTAATETRAINDRQAMAERLAELEAENQRLREEDAQLRQQQDSASQQLAQLKQQKMNETASPQLNVLAVDVYPLDLTQRSQSPVVNELVIGRSANAVTLILNSQSNIEHRSYSVEIVNARNNVVWSDVGLVRQPTNDYTINIPASFLDAGGYTINVYGISGATRIKVDSYRIRVIKR